MGNMYYIYIMNQTEDKKLTPEELELAKYIRMDIFFKDIAKLNAKIEKLAMKVVKLTKELDKDLKNMDNNKIALCDRCNTMKHQYQQHEGLEICARCWPTYAEENGLCESCSTPLEAIYENNGYTEPDPTHYEIVGYKPCAECAYIEE